MLFRAPLHFYCAGTLENVLKGRVSMLFRAPLHFYLSAIACTARKTACVNALSSSTSFLRAEFFPEYVDVNCVNALSSSTSFLLSRILVTGKYVNRVSMLFRAPLHFYLLTRAYKHSSGKIVSMLFRAPLHFYIKPKKGQNDHLLCQCSFELHFISTFPCSFCNGGTGCCVNALSSSTSFLPEYAVVFGLDNICVNALSSSTSFLPRSSVALDL